MNPIHVIAWIVALGVIVTFIMFMRYLLRNEHDDESADNISHEQALRAFSRMQLDNKAYQDSSKGKPNDPVNCLICGRKVLDPDNAMLIDAMEPNIKINLGPYYKRNGVKHLFPQFDAEGNPTCPGSKSRATRMASVLPPKAREFYALHWHRLSKGDKKPKKLKFRDDPRTLQLYDKARQVAAE